MWQDLRFALRQLWKSPAFSLVAVLTLALGIGANTAIFTLLDQALLRMLPVSHPEQLVRLRYEGSHSGNVNYYGGDEHDYFSTPAYRQLRDKSSVFSGVIANAEAGVGVRWNDQPELSEAELVSANYFDVLGVKPGLGRLLLPSDDGANRGNPVVVLSFSYWKTRFNSDPSVIGKALLVNGQPFTIVGVVQPGFKSVISGYAPKLFFPLSTTKLVNPGMDDPDDSRSAWVTVEARLAPGFTRARAEAAISPLWQSIRREQLAQAPEPEQLLQHGFVDKTKLLVLDNARGFSPMRDDIRVPLLILMGMVALVLLMACVNVSSLLMVRAAGRVREMSLRYSLGASRWQVIRQLLVEGVLLGLLGSVVGIAIAPALSSFLIRRVISDPTVDLPFSSQPDLRVFLFNFALALVVSLLFSMAPSFRFLYPDLVNSLKQQSGTATGGNLRFRRVSVGLQIGLSLLLLVGAGLFVQTLRHLRNVDVGFEREHLLSFALDPQQAGYKAEDVAPLRRHVLHTLSSLPGARSVAATTDPELMGMESVTSVSLLGSTTNEPILAEAPWITPNYFATTGIQLLAGRDFTDSDLPDTLPVVIVNDSFAKHHFGSAQNAIGKYLEHGNKKGKTNFQIVGVVSDTRHVSMRSDVKETLYRAVAQLPQPSYLQYYVRTWQSPGAAKADVRAAMQQLDSKLVVDGLRTMDEQVAQSVSNDQMVATLAVMFGVLATMMAAIGLYGVLAYSTAQRTHEIGIRMALGAGRKSVVRLVLSDVMWLAGISIVVTLPLSLLLARTLRSQLYNVSPADPLVISAAVLMVVIVVAAAALLPARRAASVEPMQALRME